MAASSVAVTPASGLRPFANIAIFNVTATADADTTITIAHGLKGVPEEVYLELAGTAAGIVAGRLSNWGEVLASRTSTNIVLNKGTGAGSGSPDVQLQVIIKLGNSLVR
jgi:hypothetical protein